MKKRHKLLSLLLVLTMCLGMANLTTLAVAPAGHTHNEDGWTCVYTEPVTKSVCPHAHDATCGYVAPTEEIPCDCADTDEDGVIDHVDGCGYTPAAPGSPCDHECGEACIQVVTEGFWTCTAPADEDQGTPARAAKKGGEDNKQDGNLETDSSGKIEKDENLSQYENGKPITVDKVILFKQADEAILVVPEWDTRDWETIKKTLPDGKGVLKLTPQIIRGDGSASVNNGKTVVTVENGVAVVSGAAGNSFGDLSHITWAPTIPNPDPTPTTTSLTVKKLVTYDAETSNAPDANQTFTIVVQLGSGSETAMQVTGNEVDVGSAADVTYSLTLKADESVTFTNIPEGTTYTVTEPGLGEKWTSDISEDTGTANGQTVIVTNTYADPKTPENPDPDPKTGSLSIAKDVTGLESTDGLEFTFTVTGPNAYSETLTVQAGKTGTLENLPTGEYTIAEAETAVDGYTWDGVEFTGVNDADSNAEGFQIEVTEDAKDVAVTATNDYTKDTTTETTSITGTKIWVVPDGTAATSLPLDKVQFQAYNGDEAVGEPVGLTEGLGNYTFTFTIAGLPKLDDNGAEIPYTVKEVGESNGEITLDGKTYTVTYKGYEITNTLKNAPENPNPETKTGKLSVTKTVNGLTDALTAGLKFTFTVTGPNAYSETLIVQADETGTLENLTAGMYTITETGTTVEGYNWNGVTFDVDDADSDAEGFQVHVTENGTVEVTATNAYSVPNTTNPPRRPTNPTTEIPDDEVPLTELPEITDSVEIQDGDVPLTELPDEAVPLAELPDEAVPLAEAPQTGDNSWIWAAVTLASACGLIWLTLQKRKTSSDN